jgi:hypothetical protein
MKQILTILALLLVALLPTSASAQDGGDDAPESTGQEGEGEGTGEGGDVEDPADGEGGDVEDPADGEGEEAAKPAGPEPEFKNEKAAASFASGKELFEKGDYKAALKALKSASAGAKDAASKKLVKIWETAAQHAPGLVQAEKLIAAKRWMDANATLQPIQEKLAGTPAYVKWVALATQVETALYEVLESFDRVTASYSAKLGKTFVSDAAQVLRGARCLRWQSTKENKGNVLRIQTVPADWNKFEAVEFFVSSAADVPIEAVLFTDKDPKAGGARPGAAAPPPGKKIVTSFLLPYTIKGTPGRWQLVVLKIAQFKSQGEATLAAVKDFRLQISSGRRYDFLIDEIRLRRKDATAPAGK